MSKPARNLNESRRMPKVEQHGQIVGREHPLPSDIAGTQALGGAARWKDAALEFFASPNIRARASCTGFGGKHPKARPLQSAFLHPGRAIAMILLGSWRGWRGRC